MNKIILFDLDGTLLDTSIDLTHALNATLNYFNKPSKTLEEVKPTIGGGVNEIISRGFAMNANHPDFKKICQHYLNAYSQNIALNTTLYPGMEYFLNKLKENQFNWGIVTNKPRWLSQPLLEALHLLQEAACVICGDSLPVKKPDPFPLLYACAITNTIPHETTYIGDTQTDIKAARAAKMKSIAVTYGYRYPIDDPTKWEADCIVNHASELWPIVSAN